MVPARPETMNMQPSTSIPLSDHATTRQGSTQALLREGIRQLEHHELQQPPRRMCELLLCAIQRCTPLDFMTAPPRLLPTETVRLFREGIARLAAGEPLQYITGIQDFMEYPFRVDSRALIPRPESETLVLTALADTGLWDRTPQPLILDLGTGSGCLTIALALARPAASYLAADSSAAARTLARENAHVFGLEKRIQFISSNGLSRLADNSLDAIISNPPYIKTADYLRLPRYIRDHEPRAALDGGPDGLALIQHIISEAPRCLRSDGRLFLEIGHGQGATVLRHFREATFRHPTLVYDIAGRERVVWGVLSA